MFDYLPLSAPLLARILGAADQLAVLTVPRRRWGPQRMARRAWLSTQGVKLHAYSVEEVQAIWSRAATDDWIVSVAVPELLPDNIWIVGRRRET